MSLRHTDEGGLLVELYRLDETVSVRIDPSRLDLRNAWDRAKLRTMLDKADS